MPSPRRPRSVRWQPSRYYPEAATWQQPNQGAAAAAQPAQSTNSGRADRPNSERQHPVAIGGGVLSCSEGGNDGGEQSSALRQAGGDDLLMRRVSTLPNRTEAIEARHTEPPRQVRVRSAGRNRATDRLTDRPSRSRDLLQQLIAFSGRLPGGPTRDHRHLDPSTVAHWLQRADGVEHRAFGTGVDEPEAEVRRRGSRYDVRPPAAGDRADVAQHIVEGGHQRANGGQLVDQFVDRRHAGPRVQRGVGFLPGDLDPDPAAAATSGLQVTVEMRRLEPEGSDHTLGLSSDKVSRGG